MDPIFHKTKKLHTFHKNEKTVGLPYQVEDDNDSWEWVSPTENCAPATFCMETSIHGLQHLAQPKRHIFERMFWLCTFLASVVIGIGLIWQSFQDYKNIPIITILNPTQKTLQEIPFPAVTVCSVNSLRSTEVRRLISKVIEAEEHAADGTGKDMLDKLRAKLFDINHICDATSPYSSIFEEGFLDYGIAVALFQNYTEALNHSDPAETLRSISQPCSEMILNCLWMGQNQSCTELFHEIATDFGYCCTFNTIPMSLLMKNSPGPNEKPEYVDEWKKTSFRLEDLLVFKENVTYPYRQKYVGRRGGLSFTLNPDLKDYHEECSNTDSMGFFLDVNMPFEIPMMKDYGVAIRTNSEMFIAIEPEVIMPDESVKDFPVETRDCYYSDEMELPHYTVYTDSNCRSECIAKIIMAECNCTLYYMPQSRTNPTCGKPQYECAFAVQEKIITEGLEKSCNECRATCTEISYQAQVTSLMLQKSKIKTILKGIPNIDNVTRHPSIVHVYFDADAVYPKLRKETTSLIQLLANIGGLLGVCLGCSIMSLLEICYYSTIRVCCHRRYERKNVEKIDNNVRTVVTKHRHCNKY